MTYPNFFIAGAPKCGTTSMYHYLYAHPQVFMPREKEPHYFATDLPIYRRMTEQGAYLDLFRDSDHQHRAVGEASVWYLFSKNAIPTILEFNPDAKFLVFFRNPVDFVQSLHAQFAYNNGRAPDFVSAWDSAEKRARLVSSGSFGEQLERLRAVVPESQYLVVIQDDLRQAPRREYLRVIDLLGLDDDGRTDFSTYNAHKVHRSPALARFAKRTPAPLEKFWRMTKRLTGVKGLGLMDRIHAMNTKPVKREPINSELRQSIREAFADDVALLGEQLGRDLSHWR